MLKQRIKKIISLFTNAPILIGALCGVLFVFIFFQTALAEESGWGRVTRGFKTTAGEFFTSFRGENEPGDKGDPFKAYSFVVNAFVGVMGVVFLTNIVIAGFQWMNAGGDSEAVKKAQTKIINNIIGIIIIFGAYIITNFIISSLTPATGVK